MKDKIINIIEIGYPYGIGFAVGMGVFDYFLGSGLGIWKSIFYFVFFGAAMGWVNSKPKEQSKGGNG
ncbi:MAG: hypothetical protein WBG46_03465 [Nonlabens sp.]